MIGFRLNQKLSDLSVTTTSIVLAILVRKTFVSNVQWYPRHLDTHNAFSSNGLYLTGTDKRNTTYVVIPGRNHEQVIKNKDLCLKNQDYLTALQIYMILWLCASSIWFPLIELRKCNLFASSVITTWSRMCCPDYIYIDYYCALPFEQLRD